MDPTNTNTALASVFVEELARSGVRRAVICPGSRSSPLALALLREPGIETSTVVDERSAGFVALGMAMGGEPTAVTCTSGTAAANLHPAVAEADLSHVPLLVLTNDRPPELRENGSGQTIDQIKLYGSAVRWFFEVGMHDADEAGLLHLRTCACRAFTAAAGGSNSGPVHLNLSWRDPLGPEPIVGAVTATDPLALEGRGDAPLTRVAKERVCLEDGLLDGLASTLAATGRGLIIAGRQSDPAVAPAVAGLAQASGFPILAEPTSQLRSGAHERSSVVGRYDAIAKGHPEALAPELVVRFGELPTSKALRGWMSSLRGCDEIVVDSSGGWYEPTRRARAIVRADPGLLADSLSARLGGQTGEAQVAFTRSWLDAERTVEAAVESALEAGSQLSELSLWPALAAAAGDGELVFAASSMPIRDLEAFWPQSERELLFLSNRGANGIDGTISSAVGAAIATGRPTWVVLGDLALHHDSNGLAAIRHSPVPIRVIVVNNDGGGIFELLPQAEQVDRAEFEAIFGTPLGLEPERYAALHDLPYSRLEAPADLDAVGGGPSCVAELRVARKETVVLRRAVADAAARALA